MTVAQALHWFDRPKFYAEVCRVARERGLLAVWSYGLARITPEVDAEVEHLYGPILGPYWPAERRIVEEGYATIEFPFGELTPPAFAMTARWNFDELFGYLGTWSSAVRYAEHRGATRWSLCGANCWRPGATSSKHARSSGPCGCEWVTSTERAAAAGRLFPDPFPISGTSMVSVDEALAIGTSRHQAGQFGEAERIYRQILAVEPDHPHALHQLGILAMQHKQFAAATELFEQAIRGNRLYAPFHANLGEAFRHLHRHAEAIACYRAAVKLEPNLMQAHMMLGNVLRLERQLDESVAELREALRIQPESVEARTQLGHTLLEQQKWSDAQRCYERALRGEPRSALAHFNLGNLLQATGRLAEAETLYCQALELDPRFVNAHNNLGTILKAREAYAEAKAHYQQAIEIKPDCAAAHANLGAIYYAEQEIDKAADSYRAALAVEPTMVLARLNLGTMLVRQSRSDEALECFEEVLRVEPDNALAYCGVANVYQVKGRLQDAITYCQHALRIEPGNFEAYSNMGVAWSELGHRDEGIECCRKALELNPLFAPAHGNLAGSLQALGQLDEAIDHYRRAVALAPEDAAGHSNLLYCLNYHPGYDAETLYREHIAWAARHAEPLTAVSPPHTNDRNPDRRLRVGYVSPHFNRHAVNFFSEPILASHDHDRFEVFCYSNVRSPDETTDRLRGYADGWRDTLVLNDEQLAAQVRSDQIDILVDLTGHIAGGQRLLAFARKPAPVQVTYIGYQNTTGMRAMDYRLTDEHSDPPGKTEHLHSEQLVRLPRSFFCYLPSSDAPTVNPPPALERGYVTFGSMNNFSKITPQVLETWARILHRVSGSRLLIRADMTPWLREHLTRTFSQWGIDAARLELVNRVIRADYLELIRGLDIALDPFPFNGHTTTCDCFWQGVPVVSLAGETYVSRFGSSAMVTLGLEELIVRSPDEYVEVAAQLAADAPRRQQLRDALRTRMAASPILDFTGFTRNLEAEYRRMWHRWCAAPSR